MAFILPVDLAAALQPIAAALLPGWQVTCEELSPEEMDGIFPGALAVCTPTPTRSIAHVRVVTPWPSTESLVETLWHEVTHAALSPITSQLGDAPGTVMVEEQIVERLGNLLAKIPMAARLAVARAINLFAPAPMRARLSTASAGHRARTGEPMDPETIQKMIDALKAGDGESALKMCEEALVKAASGGAAPAGEPDGDEARAEIPPGHPSGPADDAPESQNLPGGKAMIDPKAPAGPATPSESPGRAAARIAALDAQVVRARKAADGLENARIRARLRDIRQDGVTLPTNIEASIAKMSDYDAAEQRLSDILEGRKLATPGGTRARATTPNAAGAPPPSDDEGPVPVGEDTLKAEGFDPRFIAHYAKTAATDRTGASIQLNAARARLRGGLVTRERALRNGVRS